MVPNSRRTVGLVGVGRFERRFWLHLNVQREHLLQDTGKAVLHTELNCCSNFG